MTKAGTCSGNTLNWCFNGKLFTQDCTADKGSTCQTSGGSSTCKTADSSAKATAPASTISVPCGDVTDAGTCSGNTLKWCLNGALTTVDCTVDRGYTCNAKSDGSSTCGPKGSDGAACGTSVTYAGSCDHDTLTWCAGGVVATENCKTDENGSVCKAVGGDSNCYPPTATTCADGTTYAGSCSNGSLTWCANGKTMTENCAANENGASCTVVNGDADCRSSGSGSSSSTCADGSTYAGTCSNGVLKWCSGGTPMTDGCAANHAGTTCTVVNDDANCRASSTGTGSSSGCSDGSTYAGSCSGTTLTYCDNGTTSVKNCTSYGDGYTCMKVNGDSDCRAQNGGDCAGIPSGGQCDDDYTYVYCVNNVKQVQHCDLANWICVDSGTQASCASP